MTDAVPQFSTVPCAETDPEIFFTEMNNSTLYAINVAKALCDGCWFKDECLKMGLEWDTHGIWGGMTRNERRRYAGRNGIPLRKYWMDDKKFGLAE